MAGTEGRSGVGSHDFCFFILLGGDGPGSASANLSHGCDAGLSDIGLTTLHILVVTVLPILEQKHQLSLVLG
ncbi:MAG: hypothetical protein V4733_01840 [Verrucomicrobiota bacterium]